MEFEKRCWAQISLDNLRHNFKIVKEKANQAEVMAVVKADGYGHGDAWAARLFAECGASALAVSGFEEALRLVDCGVEKPILILGYTDASHARELCAFNITQTVFSADYAAALSKSAVLAGCKVKVHFKLDTGMSRLGFGAVTNTQAAIDEIKTAISLPGLLPEGLYTHFSVADSTSESDVAYTKAQYEIFKVASAQLPELKILHCSNSAATLAYPEYAHSLVRPGIILYGENPSQDVNFEGLKPALQLKAVVSHVKTIGKGQCVSYGRQFTSDKPIRVATLAVGYADGYPRALSQKGTVSINGSPCKILGNVCMDQMIVDITNVPNTKIGDVAIIFGGDKANSAKEVAQLSGTIVYEILCGLGHRVPRVYVDNGTTVAVVDYLR